MHGGDAGPRPGEARQAVWEADDESDDDEGDDAMTSEQLRRAEEELLEGDEDSGVVELLACKILLYCWPRSLPLRKACPLGSPC